jgi:hypothetical protein
MSTLRNTVRETGRTRRIARVATALGIAAAAGGLAACAADRTVAPATTQAFQPGAHRDLGSTTISVGALTRTTALPADTTIYITVTPNGGGGSIQSAGLSVTFPKGFVSQPTTFWVTAKAGSVVAYDFGPSGTFSAPVAITQKLQGTNAFQLGTGAYAGAVALQGAYVQDWSQVSQSTGTASVNELESSSVNVNGNTLSFNVWHFSGYMVSTGRAATGDQQ